MKKNFLSTFWSSFSIVSWLSPTFLSLFSTFVDFFFESFEFFVGFFPTFVSLFWHLCHFYLNLSFFSKCLSLFSFVIFLTRVTFWHLSLFFLNVCHFLDICVTSLTFVSLCFKVLLSIVFFFKCHEIDSNTQIEWKWWRAVSVTSSTWDLLLVFTGQKQRKNPMDRCLPAIFFFA